VSFLNTKHEKKSFTITVVLHVLLILLLLFVGMQYLDPPPEKGIAINFGTSEVGSGDVQPTEPVKAAPQPTTSPQTSQPDPVVEEVVTQETVDAPVIEKKAEKKPVVQEKVAEPKPVPPAPKPDPTPEKSTTDALSSILMDPAVKELRRVVKEMTMPQVTKEVRTEIPVPVPTMAMDLVLTETGITGLEDVVP
jgi:periplasmic protein TonB